MSATRHVVPRFAVGFVAALVFATDALSVAMATSVLGEESVELLPGMTLRVVRNDRGPFSLGPLWLAVLAGGLALWLLFRYRFARPALAWRERIAFELLLGGGLANLGERILLGHVTDVIVLGRVTAVNLADIAILFGIILLLWPQRSAQKDNQV